MNSIENKQRGGVAAFVVVGVVLTALLAGGIYLSKNQGRTAVAGDSTTVNTPVKVTDTDKKQNDTPASTQNTPASTPSPSPTQNNPQNTAASQPSGIANTGPTAIASTGPGDVLISTIAISVLVASMSAYRMSIQRIRTAALK